jgi:hypothetical protein
MDQYKKKWNVHVQGMEDGRLHKEVLNYESKRRRDPRQVRRRQTSRNKEK